MTVLGPIRAARAGDRPAVTALLGGAELPLDGIPADLDGFHVAEMPGAGVIGVVGLERYGVSALVRSVVVSERFRARGIGRQLVTEVLRRAERDGAEEIFLLTTTAGAYFARFGFVAITRQDLPDAVFSSAELRGACPETAHVMRWTGR